MFASIPEATGVWRFEFHPEVWVLIVGLIGLYVWAVKVVGPKAVAEGEPVLTRTNIWAAVVGIVLLWVASDYPMHDIGEKYLYAVHMVQHTLITLVVPPLALLALPRWLADLILGQGRVRRVVQIASIPVVAAVAYNAMVIAGHWPALVNASVENGLLHYIVHIVLVFTALMMWMPVCGPIQEWRMGIPGRMIYLFLMSVVPTVPGGWMTFAEGAVYKVYDTPTRAFGISVQDDQQAAGVFMKLFAGGYLWAIITALFFYWAFSHQRAQQVARETRKPFAPVGPRIDPSEARPSDAGTASGDDDDSDVLTYESVAKAFADSDPIAERTRPDR